MLTVGLRLAAGAHLIEELVIVRHPGLEGVNLAGPDLCLVTEVPWGRQGGELGSCGDVLEERSQCGVCGTDGASPRSLTESKVFRIRTKQRRQSYP